MIPKAHRFAVNNQVLLHLLGLGAQSIILRDADIECRRRFGVTRLVLAQDSHGVLDQARVLLEERHGLGHATLQIEPDDHRGCDELTW